jgi:hypothetical protein
MKTLVVTVDVLRLQSPGTIHAESLRQCVSAELHRWWIDGGGRVASPSRPIPRLTVRAEPGADATSASARALSAALRQLFAGER